MYSHRVKFFHLSDQRWIPVSSIRMLRAVPQGTQIFWGVDAVETVPREIEEVLRELGETSREEALRGAVAPGLTDAKISAKR